MSVAEGCRFYWMTSLEHIDNTEMSWQHWPKTEVKVWWTIGMNELSRRLPNPNNHGDGVKCHVQERLATIKIYVHFPKISPVIYSTSTFLFFNKLEEDNIFLIYNSTLRVNNVSLFNNLTSLAMNETRFFPWLTSQSLFYVLTSLAIVIARSFFMFRECEKED